MAKKERNKRSARKARAEERARVEAAQVASAPAPSAEDEKSKAKAEKKAEKAEAKAEKKAEKDKRRGKPSFFQRIKNYLSDVRSEMKRVTWPSKEEVKSYSVAVLIMIVVAGVLLWLVDTGIVALLAAFTGLRG